MQVAAVIVVSTCLAPLLSAGLFRIWPGIDSALTWGTPEERVVGYIRDHEALATHLVAQPGIYRIDLLSAGDHVRIEGLVEDARRFMEVEHAFDDARELPNPPDIAIRIRNGEVESTADAGYSMQGFGRMMLVFIGALITIWFALLSSGLAWVAWRWRRHSMRRATV